MLVKFTIANYLSFKNKQTLILSADALKEHKYHLHIPYMHNPKEMILKSCALFGHNSHGKSNFLKAYAFFINFLNTSFILSKENLGIATESFKLNTSTISQPSFFEVEFITEKTKYRYGYEVTNEKIISEWLFYSEPQIRENHLFVRSEQEFQLNRSWNKESKNRIENQGIPFAKSQTLLLSVLLSQDDIPKIDLISNWISKNIILNNFNDNLEQHLKNSVAIFSNSAYQKPIADFIKNADLGFTTIFDKIEHNAKMSTSIEKEILNLWFSNEIKDFELYTSHNIYDASYKHQSNQYFNLLKKESDGTIKYFILACLMVYSMKNGNLLFIDELDSRLHFLLFDTIIKQFHSNKHNVKGSQLVFTAHNTILLDKQLRRDQIILVEKNEFGESSIRRLHTKETPVRIDTSIEKDYRKGEFGGVSKKLIDITKNSTLFE